MSYITDTLHACEYLLEKAARNNFIVDVRGTKHGCEKINRRTVKQRRTLEWMRERRRKIVELHEAGVSARDIAMHVGCNRSLVYVAVSTHRRELRLHAS